MKKPPRWYVVSILLCGLVALTSAFIGGASSTRVPHALLGALSLLGVTGMWFLWLVWGTLDDSLLSYWIVATIAVFTMCLAGCFYFVGFNWAGVLGSAVFAPLIGGGAVLRVAMWRSPSEADRSK
jgi:hypothetical protein